ncbi:MAG: acyl carrier protein [Bacteriovoracales bacterium]|nr:acyl carrier protein [Bacteriovoracales bacterium]
MATAEERIKKLIHEHLDLGREPNLDAKLTDAGVSSVQAVAFGKEVAKEFNLSMSPGDCANLQTLRDFVTYIDSKS